MKKFLSIASAFVAALCLTACGSKTQSAETAADSTATKYLVLYYSQTGATKTVAEALQKALDADIAAIELETPYDSSYDKTIERVRLERADSITPAIKPLTVNLDDYDVIFLGYPIWFGTYALPIATLLKDNNLDGRTIVPFCTFGSGGQFSAFADLKVALPNAKISEGYGVRNARLSAMPKELDRFLKENGYVEGEVESLPDFSSAQPVTEADIAIFNAACSSYRFPLGTPTTVASRTTADGTDYEFNVKSDMPDGEASMSTIYVTVSNEEGATPEFTQVVRWAPLNSDAK